MATLCLVYRPRGCDTENWRREGGLGDVLGGEEGKEDWGRHFGTVLCHIYTLVVKGVVPHIACLLAFKPALGVDGRVG